MVGLLPQNPGVLYRHLATLRGNQNQRRLAVQMLILGGIFFVIGIASDSVWAVAAGVARDRLIASPQGLERFGWVVE